MMKKIIPAAVGALSVFGLLFSACCNSNGYTENYYVKPTAYSEGKLNAPCYAMASMGIYSSKDISQTVYGDSLHLSVSGDGLNWFAINLNEPVYEIGIGTGHVRNPSVFRLNDGTFVLLAEDFTSDGQYSDIGNLGDTAYGDKPSSNVYVAFSDDLISWKKEHLLTLTAATGADGQPRHVWTPHAVYNKDLFCYDIYWTGDDENGVNSVYVSSTVDFFTLKDTDDSRIFAPGYSVTGSYITGTGDRLYVVFMDDEEDLASGKGLDVQIGVLNGGWRSGLFKVLTSRYQYITRGTSGVMTYSSLPCMYLLPDNQTWILLASNQIDKGTYKVMSTTTPEDVNSWADYTGVKMYTNGANYKTEGASILKITNDEMIALKEAF